MSIIILGMHRSGTSAVTRLLGLMGAYLGEPHELLAPDKDNPKGFWERNDVLACNRELLRLSHCAWHATANWNPTLAPPPELKTRMQSIIRAMDAHAPWAIKDPRLCLTLPHWLPYLRNPTIIVAARNPLEIAQSLRLRNDMPPDYALALWEHHAVHAIRSAHALPRIHTSFDSLLHNPVAETARLHSALATPGLAMPPADTIRSFIEPTLKRAAAADLTLTPYQELLASMLRGETPMDGDIALSPTSNNLLKTLAGKISGAAV